MGSEKVWTRHGWTGERRIACYSFLNPAKMCYNSTNLLEYMKVLENFYVFLAKEVGKVCIQMIVWHCTRTCTRSTWCRFTLTKGFTIKKAVFEVYFRQQPFKNGYAVFAGLERIVSYLEDLRFSDSDIAYLESLGYHGAFLDYLRNFKLELTVRSAQEGDFGLC